MKLSFPTRILLSVLLILACLSVSLGQDKATADRLNYLDQNGHRQKITNVQEEYYFKRIHTAQLHGSTDANAYWMDLYVGNPPQQQSVILSTDSSNLLAFPCSECKENCGQHFNPYYNLTKSMTGKKLPCNGEFNKFKCNSCNQSDNNDVCSWERDTTEESKSSGFMATDFISFGEEMQAYLKEQGRISIVLGLSQGQKIPQTEEIISDEYLKFMIHESVEMPFGCTTNENHLLRTQTPDGTISLGPLSNQLNQPPNIIDQLFEKHKENSEQLAFSICFSQNEGGYLSVGGYNHELHLPNEKSQIVPYQSDKGFYEVNILSVKVDDQVVSSTLTRSFLEPGTSLVYGPAEFIDPLIQELNYACNTNSQKYKCGGAKNIYSANQRTFKYVQSQEFPTEREFLDSFPAIKFEFQGDATIEWQAHGYLYKTVSMEGVIFNIAMEFYPTQYVYLGGPFFKNLDVLFDKQNQKIHFTPSECSLPNINSVLMNIHSSKIRTTINDTGFIKELDDFRKSHNINFYVHAQAPVEEKDPKQDKPEDKDPKKDNPEDKDPKKDKPEDNDPKKDNPENNDPKKDKPEDKDPKKDKPEDKDPQKDKPEDKNPKKDEPDNNGKNQDGHNNTDITPDNTNTKGDNSQSESENLSSDNLNLFIVSLVVIAIILAGLFCMRIIQKRKNQGLEHQELQEEGTAQQNNPQIGVNQPNLLKLGSSTSENQTKDNISQKPGQIQAEMMINLEMQPDRPTDKDIEMHAEEAL